MLALDGERLDFEGLTEELNYDVYGNYVISHTPGEIANCVEGFRRVHGIDKRRHLNYNKAQTM